MFDEDNPEYCPMCDEAIDEDGCCACPDDEYYHANDNRMWDGEQFVR